MTAELKPGAPAPYTTAVSALRAMEAFRERGLASPVTSDVLIRAGVNETIAARTLTSLKLLGLIEDDGKPSQQWEEMRLSRTEEEYRERLQAWIRGIYADILQYVDPAVDDLSKVTNAFRGYEPAGQRPSMAALFLALWRYAGLSVVEEGGTRPMPARQQPRERAPRTPGRSARQATMEVGPSLVAPPPSSIPPALAGLLQQIPPAGKGWRSTRRDEFLAAFRAVLDFTIPIEDGDTGPQLNEEEAPLS